MNHTFLARIALVALGAFGLMGRAETKEETPRLPRIVVASDLTKIGKKEGRVPDADHPVYYVPLTPGLAAATAKPPAKDGKQSKKEAKEPTKEEVLGRLIPVLAKRHYLPAGPGHPPELALSFWWGTADPGLEDYGTDDALEEDSFNERAMIALVGADKKQELMSWHSKDLRSAARQERHYIIVMAFDYAAAVQKQKKILWITRVSTPSDDSDLMTALPALVATGGAAFGRDTPPSWVDTGRAREGNVTLAPLEVKEMVPEKK